MSTEELKPCPCCGSTDIKTETSVSMRHHFVECQGCGLATAGWSSPERSTTKWNDRAFVGGKFLEALTPSSETKAAYMGEFMFPMEGRDEDGEEHTIQVYVPWTTIKDIMKAIRERACATVEQKTGHPSQDDS